MPQVNLTVVLSLFTTAGSISTAFPGNDITGTGGVGDGVGDGVPVAIAVGVTVGVVVVGIVVAIIAVKIYRAVRDRTEGWCILYI